MSRCPRKWVQGQAYPTLLEAVLRAEETTLDAELDAGGTLERVGLLLAAYAEARPGSGGHLERRYWYVSPGRFSVQMSWKDYVHL